MSTEPKSFYTVSRSQDLQVIYLHTFESIHDDWSVAGDAEFKQITATDQARSIRIEEL